MRIIKRLRLSDVEGFENYVHIIETDSFNFLIDTGTNKEDLKIIEKNLNKNKPLYIINTHSHYDHIGNNLYLNFQEILNFNSKLPLDIDGLFIFKNIGHTNDGISVYDKETKSMFVGDNLADKGCGLVPILNSSLKNYKNSLKELLKYDIKNIYPAHNDILSKDFIFSALAEVKRMEKEKRLLIVVDYQNDFVDGALGFSGAEKLEDNILESINAFEEDKQDIIFTFDTHQRNYMETMEGKKLPVPHCIEGTNGHKLYGKIQEKSKNHMCILKDTFGSKELLYYLDKNHYDYVELVGLVSSICVFSNAVIAKTALPNAKIVVRKDCTSSFDLEMQQKSFDVLNNLHIEVI